MKKTAIATALLLASGAASAATGELCMFDATGAVLDGGWATSCDQSITASLSLSADASANTITSSELLLGDRWTAHDITTYTAGTYSVDTGAGMYNFTVAEGQVGAHMLLDWGLTSNIDVVNVWDVSSSGDIQTYTSTDWDGDGIPGGAMLDSGALVGFSASFNLEGSDLANVNITPPSAVPVPAAVWLFGSGLLGLVGVARRKTV